MSILSDLQNTTLKLLGAEAADNTINKENIEDFIQLQISAHQSFLNAFKDLEKAKLKILKQYIKDNKNKLFKTKQGVKVYDSVYKQLSSKVKSMEDNVLLSTIGFTNKAFIEILNLLLKNIDEYVKTKNVNLHNVKLSHTVILGVLNESTIVATYSTYLISSICDDIRETESFPYIIKYLNDNLNIYSKIVNNVCLKTGAYSFMQNIKTLKSTNADILLLDDHDRSNLQFVKAGDVLSNTQGIISSFLYIPNIFELLGQVWSNIEHNMYKKNVQNKEWLEAKIALLKLDLSGTDHNSDQYKKLEKIISAYDDMLSNTNRKLEKYLSK